MRVNIVILAEPSNGWYSSSGDLRTAYAIITFLSAANAADGEWKNWGAAPYAASQEEACRKTSLAIDGFNMPPTVKEHFKTELGATTPLQGRQRDC